jgi:hypothetical protein
MMVARMMVGFRRYTLRHYLSNALAMGFRYVVGGVREPYLEKKEFVDRLRWFYGLQSLRANIW